MNILRSCPICNHDKYTEKLVCQDYTVSKEEFKIVECNNCKFWFTNPIPESKNLGGYYESDDYVSHSNTNKGLIHKLYQSVRNYTLKQKLKLIDGLNSTNKNLLDIGSGTGEFSNICQSNGWNVIGIEPSEKARSFAKKEYQLDIREESDLKEIDPKSFDVITMWHVLEHVYHLDERMQEIKRLIKDSGYLIVAVPNRLSKDALYYQNEWAAYDVPRHLYHFTPNDIKNLSDKYEFDLVDIKPMKFDSFYVSMLSEKYKTGKINYVSAFIKGWQSNRAAGSENRYSSQIYLLKNKS